MMKIITKDDKNNKDDKDDKTIDNKINKDKFWPLYILVK